MAERTNPFQSYDWDSNDAAALGAFLRSPTGRRFLFRLRNERPPILPQAGCTLTDTSVSIAAGRAEGFEMCVEAIFEGLTLVGSDVPVTMYPNLDDDTVWPEELRSPVLPSLPTEPKA